MALGAVAERAQPDRHPRLGIQRTGALLVGDARFPVSIRDVSAGGVGLAANDLPVPAGAEPLTARLQIDPIGPYAGDRTLPLRFVHTRRLGADTVYGFEFETLEPEEYFVLADLMYGDSDALPRFLQSRRKHKNIFAGAGQFLWWGASEPFRAFRYALKARKPKADAGEAAPTQPSTVWLRRFARFAKEGAPASKAAPVAASVGKG